MPPADQIQTLDSGHRVNKDPLDPANDFLAVELSLRILQLSVKILKDALDNNNNNSKLVLVPKRELGDTWRGVWREFRTLIPIRKDHPLNLMLY